MAQLNITEWIGRYQNRSLEQAKTEKLMILFYVEDYGYSEELVRAIAHGRSSHRILNARRRSLCVKRLRRTH
ncbi:MAG: hypothetical protein ACFCUV_25280 [Rivularia sp. (in: cyanobacteria)]